MSFYAIVAPLASEANPMPRREPDFYEKRQFDDGAILEVEIYVVPAPVPGSAHRLKYSLFYARMDNGLSVTIMSGRKGIIGTTETWRRYINSPRSNN